MNLGQWGVMEEWRKVDGMMRVKFAEEEAVDLFLDRIVNYG